MENIRQLAAIMFSDIVGYSSMMSQDEGRALAIRRENQLIQKTLVEQYRGMWLKEMGDGALAKFDTADDSVKCAIAIQNALRKDQRFKVRIGIHLGDITIENGDVFGDGVNIASRIETSADPGGIYISESVHKAILARNEVEVKDLGEYQLKNIAYPVRIYAVCGPGFPAAISKKGAHKGIWKLALGLIAVLLMVAGYFLQQYFNTSANQLEKTSVAVLPFDNLSADPELVFLVDGLHDALIGKLSQIPDLRVISRTSTLQYRDTELPIPTIAQQLNVNHVIETSILEQNDAYIIQMQLIEAFPMESHRWSQEYEKGMGELLNMQDDVALAIASSMNLDASNLSTNKEVVDPEVYKLYLRGMYALDKGTKEDMLAGMEFLEQAVDLDPTAAFAYAGLAQGYVILGHSSLSKSEHFVKAKAAANQALAINPNLADAYAALADVKMYYDWDYPGARADFEKAVQLKPNLELAHAHYTWLHAVYEDWERAIYHGNLTIEIDPFSALYSGWLSGLYWYAGKREEALEWAYKTLDLNPKFPIALMVIGSVLAEQGSYQSAIDTLQLAVDLSPRWVGHLTRALMFSGNEDEALKVFDTWSNNPKTSDMDMSYLHIALGDYQQAMYYLEKVVESRSQSSPWIHADPLFSELHTHPRFINICREANIPPEVLNRNQRSL